MGGSSYIYVTITATTAVLLHSGAKLFLSIGADNQKIMYLCSRNSKQRIAMGSIFVIQGILIYIYAFDHNPPHIHVRSGTDNFSITLEDRIIEGKARSKTVQIINNFIDEHKEELMELWGKAQRGEKITKIK